MSAATSATTGMSLESVLTTIEDMNEESIKYSDVNSTSSVDSDLEELCESFDFKDEASISHASARDTPSKSEPLNVHCWQQTKHPSMITPN